MPSAVVTALVAAPPSICPMEGTDVQATIRALRSHAGACDSLPESGAGLGRAHRLGPRPGQKLEADGIRMPVPVGRTRRKPRLAVHPGHDHAVGGASRSSRPGPSGRARESLLSADGSTNRVSSREIYRG